jgi:hypothetical protein
MAERDAVTTDNRVALHNPKPNIQYSCGRTN